MKPNRHPLSRCDGVIRRDVITVGGLTAFGLGLPDLFGMRRLSATLKQSETKAKSCIVIWLDGGPSHLETFDLKPQAPAEVRGPFQSIATTLPGVQICDLMPRTAQMMNQVAVIRSMTSPLGEHNFGTHYLMTGYKPTPVLEYPQYGSVVAFHRKKHGVLPGNIAVPDFRVGGGKLSGNGFLPTATRPFSVGADPAKPSFQVRDLEFYPGVTAARIDRRKEFLNALDRLSRKADDNSIRQSDPQFEQAYRLISSPEAKKAFDLTAEPNSVRKRYGRKTIGQSCLLARRLIERGVGFVTVNSRGWDTHNNIYTRLKEGYTGAVKPVGLIPSLDLAFSALLEDLNDRGLLEETLIVVMGEFGRTPKLNTAGGRDHWPRVFSVAMAGGGVQGGQVIGSSDAVGESPLNRPVTPSDLAATIYTLLGIDPALEMHTADGRPVMVNQGGNVISEIVG
jgi:hypothetical protein